MVISVQIQSPEPQLFLSKVQSRCRWRSWILVQGASARASSLLFGQIEPFRRGREPVNSSELLDRAPHSLSQNIQYTLLQPDFVIVVQRHGFEPKQQQCPRHFHTLYVLANSSRTRNIKVLPSCEICVAFNLRQSCKEEFHCYQKKKKKEVKCVI